MTLVSWGFLVYSLYILFIPYIADLLDTSNDTAEPFSLYLRSLYLALVVYHFLPLYYCTKEFSKLMGLSIYSLLGLRLWIGLG